MRTSGDHQRPFFVMLDKQNTRVFVFNDDGTLRGVTPVLIGAAMGDDSIEGIGRRPIALVQAHERTTPAGRFEGERGRNASGEDIVRVVDAAAVSMHRVRANEPKERRLERLASPETQDNRISFGCVVVSVCFYNSVIAPLLGKCHGVVYGLAETTKPPHLFSESQAAQVSAARALALRRPCQDVAARLKIAVRATITRVPGSFVMKCGRFRFTSQRSKYRQRLSGRSAFSYPTRACKPAVAVRVAS